MATKLTKELVRELADGAMFKATAEGIAFKPARKRWASSVSLTWAEVIAHAELVEKARQPVKKAKAKAEAAAAAAE